MLNENSHSASSLAFAAGGNKARWARRKLAGAPRMFGSRAPRRSCSHPRAVQPRLSGDPQADRAVFLCRPQARQGAGRDVAAIRRAVPYLFHWHDHARIAGRAGAGREFRQSGRPHLLALAMELQSVRDLPARLQRRRPVPDDRSGAYAEAAPFCIRANAVTDTGCGFGPYIRAIPSHAIELASVYLDRNVAAVLARADVTASPQQKQDVAAFIHLCGGGPATAFARRKFQMLTE